MPTSGDTTGFDLLTAQEVVGQRFSQTTVRTGWDQDEVDDLLDDVEFSLRTYETPG